jgi:hypothetical protein
MCLVSFCVVSGVADNESILLPTYCCSSVNAVVEVRLTAESGWDAIVNVDGRDVLILSAELRLWTIFNRTPGPHAQINSP